MKKAVAGITLGLVAGGAMLTLGGSAQAQTGPDSGEKLALLAKPSVVRMFDGCEGSFYWPRTRRTWQGEYVGSGSGFFINPSGYIATNAHVTEMTRNPEQCAENLTERFAQSLAKDYRIDLNAMSKDQYARFLATVKAEAQRTEFKKVSMAVTADGTALPFEIKSVGAPVGEGKDVSIVKIETRNAPTLKVADSDSVRLQQRVIVAGYPAAADTEQTGILHQRAKLEASFTDGRVSAKKTMADGAPVLQISAPTTHGNSGGPVMNEKGEVVGLLTFRGDTVNGQEIQGFNFVVASNTVMEFVRQSGTTPQQGLADKAYAEGLELFWQGQYKQAIARFEEVRRLFPAHSEADRLIREAQEAIETRPAATTAPASATATPSPVTGNIKGGANSGTAAPTTNTAQANGSGNAASNTPAIGSGTDATVAGGPSAGGTSMADAAPFSIVGLLGSAVGALVLVRRSRANRKAEEGGSDEA